MLCATKVIVLFDPEYITASNHRKRYLSSLDGISTTDNSQPEAKSDAVRREMVFLDSILTSHLHRQTKSATLWFHRLWLVQNFYDKLVRASTTTGNPETDKLNGATAFFFQEFDVVGLASERHRHNYNAWLYLRRLYNMLQQRQPLESTAVMNLALLWCVSHPSDTSGWSFLDFLLLLLHHPSQTENESNPLGIVRKVLHYADSFQWQTEAVWTFLRSVITNTRLFPEREISELVALYERTKVRVGL